MSEKCPACGQPVHDDWMACANCGVPLKNAEGGDFDYDHPHEPVDHPADTGQPQKETDENAVSWTGFIGIGIRAAFANFLASIVLGIVYLIMAGSLGMMPRNLAQILILPIMLTLIVLGFYLTGRILHALYGWK